MTADITLVDKELLPRFCELDEAALRAQNSFRLVQLVIIVGGAIAAYLGIVQTALGGGVLGVALAEALVAGLLAGITMYTRSRSLLGEYLSARLEAERLRGEYFRYLGRVEPYDSKDEEERLERFRQQVATKEVST